MKWRDGNRAGSRRAAGGRVGRGRPLGGALRGARRIREDVEEEFEHHLELRTAELERLGFTPAAAREEALRRFGDAERTRTACIDSDLRRERRMRRTEYLAELKQDVAQGVRQLARRPAFAIVAILTLAVGIGANTAIFSAADHVLLRPLPYRDADRVVALWETDAQSGERKRHVATGNFVDWIRRQRVFEELALAEPWGFDLTGIVPPQPVPAWAVTPGFFRALGVSPRLGRVFEVEDFLPNAAPVVMLSHGLWQRRFGSDPNVVGRTIEMDGRAVLVVGIVPPVLQYPNELSEAWVPKTFFQRELTERTSGWMYAVGRLRPGVTHEQARADMDRVAAELAAEYPATNAGLGVNVVPLEEELLGPVRPALLVLLGAVGLVLLIVCANVAHLLLVRGVERERELAVRAALGAGRARLVRQLLAESGLLALLGGAGGVLLALGGVRALVALSPPELPRFDTVAVDARVLAFAAAVSVLTALLFGLAPALRFSRPELTGALRSGGRGQAGGERSRLRGALVIAEVALALVLLTGAGLLGRSFVSLLDNDLGFQTERRATVQLFLWDLNPTTEQRIIKVQELLDRFAALPGVTGAAAVSALPFHPSQIDATDAMSIEGRPMPEGRDPRVYTTIATPDYFQLMGIPLLRGRAFTDMDRAGAPRVALINQTLARRYFPDEDPIGRRVTVGVMSRPMTWEIVGVVGDVRPSAFDSEPRPELFVAHAQHASGSMTFVVRTAGDADALLAELQRQVWDIDPMQTIYHAETVDALVGHTLVARRFHLVLLGVFSAIALALATIGIYGVVSFTTGQRAAEIGVRMALGAPGSRIAGMIVGQALRLVLPGVVLGVLAALALGRFLEHMLYGIEPTDPVTFLQVVPLMLAAAALAAYLPARRAAAGDPMRALRAE